jgi:hypothetical protein
VLQHPLGQLSQAALQGRIAVRDILVNDYVNVRMRGVEMNASDPPPAGHVQIGLNLGHRFARDLAQSLFAFFVARAQALEVFFAKAD